jgi:predicted permease
MLADLRHAVRLLLRAKGWTAVVVLSLALGIGANTALFSAVNGLLLRKLPARDPDTLVRLRWSGKNDLARASSDYGFTARGPGGEPIRTTFSFPIIEQLRSDNQTLDDLFACAPSRMTAVVDGAADTVTTLIASGSYFRVLGVSARRGRVFTPEDDRPGAAPVAVISGRYWRARFGNDPAAIGKVILVSTVPVTIIGVTDTSFIGVQRTTAEPSDITLPLSLDPQLTPDVKRLDQPTYWWLQVVGRLRAGVTAAQVQANLGPVFQSTAQGQLTSDLAAMPEDERTRAGNRDRREVPTLLADSAARGVYEPLPADVRSATVVSVVVGVLLLIVCANVANLLLSRAAARQREIAIRQSLGATRMRLVRQLLTESLLLAFVGGASGLAIARWGQPLLPGALGGETTLDGRVLLFTVIITLLTAILFGLFPAIRATTRHGAADIKDAGRRVVGSRAWLGKSLVAVQVALSLGLLVGAALFVRTLQNLRQVDVGFKTDDLIVMQINTRQNRYDATRTEALRRDVSERISALPGVKSVAVSNLALLSGNVNGTGVFIEGKTYGRDERSQFNRLVVTPNFFATLGVPLVGGRGFTDNDRDGAPKVVVINRAAANKYFKNESPLGRRFGNSIENRAEFEIVGVLADTKYDEVRQEPPPTMYVPLAQNRNTPLAFFVKSQGAPASLASSLRSVVKGFDAGLPIFDVSTGTQLIEMRVRQERLLATAYSWFGGLAVLLSAIGIFGLMSYHVARRTGEIGVRMALGARSVDVLRMIVRESMTVVLIGIAAGTALALSLTGLVRGLLFDVAPTDPASIALAAGLMLTVSIAAASLPARRAARVDPMQALREE